jgi:hypothetical protein
MAFIHFWKRFVKEIIPGMHGRAKWRRATDNLKVDDIVMFMESKVTGRWPLARVIEVETGSDGVVRTVTIVTARNQMLERKPKYLHALELPKLQLLRRPVRVLSKMDLTPLTSSSYEDSALEEEIAESETNSNPLTTNSKANLSLEGNAGSKETE